MKIKLLFVCAISLILASKAFSSGTTIGNGISVNSTTKTEKTCKKDGKEVKVPVDEKCEEVAAEKPKDAPKEAPKK